MKRGNTNEFRAETREKEKEEEEKEEEEEEKGVLSKNKPTWQQEEISLKFFSKTTDLLSGLMRFTSKRPTW